VSLDVSAVQGGRRSRRGFAYQDVVTLLDCLDMHEGAFDEVSFEDLDDIVCAVNGHAIYRQVKTKEDGTRHSVATVCRPEIKGQVETSILGRLFSGKLITDGTRFCLVLNETPNTDLGGFMVSRGAVRGAAPEEPRRVIAERLKDLALPAGVTVSWCVDRLDVLVEARTIEQVEDAVIRRLKAPVAHVLCQQPLMEELEEVLSRLVGLVSRDARALRPRRWNAAFFTAQLEDAVARVTGRRADGHIEPLPSLASKLGAAGVPAEEADAQRDVLLNYRRRYRAAVGGERTQFDDLNDRVFAVCTEISAKRRAGIIDDGPAAYAATVQAVAGLELSSPEVVSSSDKLAALSDVTARCQNRYSDAS
jgi:hypothetical protein